MESRVEFESSQFGGGGGKATDSDDKSNGYQRNVDGSGSEQATILEDADPDQLLSQRYDESQQKAANDKD